MARLASQQYGVVAAAQLMRLGATRDVIRRRLAAGRWEQIHRGVFRLGGTPHSWEQSLMATCLAWGEGARISHRAAAALRPLAGFESRSVELTVPAGRQRRAPGLVHRNILLPCDIDTIGRIPVTTTARTLIDLASVSPREAVEEAMDDALRRGLASIRQIRWRLAQCARGRPGVTVMRSLLDARATYPVPQSVFETRLLRLIKRAGLPEPVRQYPIRNGERLIAIVDFAFPNERLAIEADVYRWHSGRARWDHDRARRNELTLLGWRVIHITWTDLSRRPKAVADSIRLALAGRAPM